METRGTPGPTELESILWRGWCRPGWWRLRCATLLAWCWAPREVWPSSWSAVRIYAERVAAGCRWTAGRCRTSATWWPTPDRPSGVYRRASEEESRALPPGDPGKRWEF